MTCAMDSESSDWPAQSGSSLYRFCRILNNQKDILATSIFSHSDKIIPTSAIISIHFALIHFSFEKKKKKSSAGLIQVADLDSFKPGVSPIYHILQ